MKNYEVLAEELTDYMYLEDFRKEYVAEYISCPSADECKYDGGDNSRCIECKIKWLESEWEQE